MITRIVILAFVLTIPVTSAESAEAPYAEKLDRLAEVLGSLHFLRNLCGEKGSRFREQMEKIIIAESPTAERQRELIATFNRGYRSFDATYRTCTESAITAIDRYMEEGQTLSRDIVIQYGN